MKTVARDSFQVVVYRVVYRVAAVTSFFFFFSKLSFFVFNMDFGKQ